MKKSICLTSILVSTLALSGCVSQQQADAKMGKGCEAAIIAMITPKTLTEIKTTTYADEKTEGGLYRRITVTAVQKDGWIETEKQYSCLFSQSWGFLKSSHTALLEQLVMDGTLIGKKDGIIKGSMEDYMKLNAAAETVMGQ